MTRRHLEIETHHQDGKRGREARQATILRRRQRELKRAIALTVER